MKKTILIFVYASLFISLTAFQCDDDDLQPNCTNQIEYLEELKANIIAIANSSVCGEEFECRYIAFGSKPCGGSWEFLFYTTSIDTMELENLVASYNALEADFNENCGAVSDCSTPIPPIDFSCENNQCIPIY